MLGTLRVNLLRAEGIPNVEWRGYVQDPYCELSVGVQTFKSLVHDNGGTSPVWNQVFTFKSMCIDQRLRIQIRDLIVNHVVGGVQKHAADFVSGLMLDTVGNRWLLTDRENGRVRLWADESSLYVVTPDLGACSVVIHLINYPLIPTLVHEKKSVIDRNWWWKDVPIGSCSVSIEELVLQDDVKVNQEIPVVLPVQRAQSVGFEGQVELRITFIPQGMQATSSGSCRDSSMGFLSPGRSPVGQQTSLRQRMQHEGSVCAPSPAGPDFGPGTPASDFGPTPRAPSWVLPSEYQDRDCRQEYQDWQVIGKSRYSAMYAVTKRATGQPYALKVVNKQTGVSSDEDARREIVVELQMLKLLQDYPNVVKLHDAWETHKQVCIAMELCTGGELFEALLQRGGYSERDAASIMRTVISVVACMHSRGIMHRDLRPENFLFTGQPGHEVLKATGFNHATAFKQGVPLTEVVGSHLYVAPEVLQESYGPEADLWSCGCILYALLSGYTPYQGLSVEAVAYAIKHQPLDLESEPWPSVSDDAKDCIRQLLTVDPTQRPTAESILQHPWLCEDGVTSDAPLVLEGLQKFTGMNKLTKLALKIVAMCLPKHEKQALRTMFREMDVDHSHTVSVAELKAALKHRGQLLREADLMQMIEAADLDGDAELDFEEFVTVMMSHAQLQQESLRNAFRHFDLDGNGTISKEELQTALIQHGLQDDDIPGILAAADKDGDNNIGFEEFCEMMQHV